MEKPRIVIADIDENYIIPFQLKFVRELRGEMDLEVITDAAYLTSFFAQPQEIDVLIIASGLFDRSMQKHNIGKIILLLENESEEQMYADLVCIYKYSGLSFIFDEVASRSGLLHEHLEGTEKPQIVVITSAAGGVGKTTVAMTVSADLARRYKRVLYINAEGLQTFQGYLKNQTPIAGMEIYAQLQKKGNAYQDVRHYIRTETFSYIPPFRASLLAMGLQEEVYLEIAKGARTSGDYDFIIVDLESAFHALKTAFLQIADKVILITKQERGPVAATDMLLRNIQVTEGNYFFVCNDFDSDKPNFCMQGERSASFTPNEYIRHVEDCSEKDPSVLAQNADFQRVAYLVS